MVDYVSRWAPISRISVSYLNQMFLHWTDKFFKLLISLDRSESVYWAHLIELMTRWRACSCTWQLSSYSVFRIRWRSQRFLLAREINVVMTSSTNFFFSHFIQCTGPVRWLHRFCPKSGSAVIWCDRMKPDFTHHRTGVLLHVLDTAIVMFSITLFTGLILHSFVRVFGWQRCSWTAIHPFICSNIHCGGDPPWPPAQQPIPCR